MDLREIGTRTTVKVTEDVAVEEAARLMREHHVGDVIVVKRRGGANIPVGMLTDRDIVMATVALGAPTVPLSVGDVMTGNPATLSYEADVGQAIRLMRERGVKRLPLVGASGEVAGVIAFDDIVAYLARQLAAVADITRHELHVEQERRRKLA